MTSVYSSRAEAMISPSVSVRLKKPWVSLSVIRKSVATASGWVGNRSRGRPFRDRASEPNRPKRCFSRVSAAGADSSNCSSEALSDEVRTKWPSKRRRMSRRVSPPGSDQRIVARECPPRLTEYPAARAHSTRSCHTSGVNGELSASLTAKVPPSSRLYVRRPRR